MDKGPIATSLGSEIVGRLRHLHRRLVSDAADAGVISEIAGAIADVEAWLASPVSRVDGAVKAAQLASTRHLAALYNLRAKLLRALADSDPEVKATITINGEVVELPDAIAHMDKKIAAEVEVQRLLASQREGFALPPAGQALATIRAPRRRGRPRSSNTQEIEARMRTDLANGKYPNFTIISADALGQTYATSKTTAYRIRNLLMEEITAAALIAAAL